MKLTKKKVFVAALAICLVAVLSFGTLAWFTAEDSVENNFKVSTNTAGDPDFKLELFESEADENGKVNGTKEYDGNTYENIAPGDVLDKDPTVNNAGQYDMWVRVKITLTGYDKWQDVLGTGYDFRNILGNVNTDWSFGTIETDNTDPNNKTLTLIYYKDTKLAVGAESTVFENVNIPSEFTVDNMPVDFNIDVVAEAIQYDNTGDTAQYAFANYWN